MGQAQLTIHLGYLLDSGAAGRVQPTDALTVDVVGTRKIGNTQQIGIAEELLQLGDVPAGGLLWLVNRGDEGTWVDLRAESGGANFIRALPGIPAVMTLVPGVRPYVIASEDYVDLEIFALEA